MAFGDNEPIGINILGGVKVNRIDSNGTVQIGESLWQSINSVNKTNAIAQIFGDFDTTNVQPVGSPLNDQDGVDSPMATNQAPFGLED